MHFENFELTDDHNRNTQRNLKVRVITELCQARITILFEKKI
jgi:hypothetical protein